MLRRVALGGAFAAIAIALAFARPAVTPGPMLRDFEAYDAAGRTWAVAGDPYGRDLWRSERIVPGVRPDRDELLPFVGPPFSLPLWRAFALLPYEAGARLWGAVLVLAAATLAFGSLALAGGRRSVRNILAAAALGLAFGPLTSAFALGQVALLSGAAVVATLLALRARRARSAAAGAILAALQPNLGIVLLARLSDRRAAFALAFAALVAAGGSLAAVGTAGIARYLALLAAHGAAERTLAIQTTVGAIAYGFGLAEGAARTLQVAVSIFVVVLVTLACARTLSDPIERVAVAAAALPVALPFAHEHDLLLVLFPALVALRRATGVLWALATSGTVLVAVDWLGLAQRPSGFAQSLLLAFASCAACVALAPRPLRIVHAIPFATLGLVVVAGLLAATHPLPVWPDALGNFHAPLALDAPAVWHLEQLRTGIGTRDWVWASLRSLSLLGCALLAFPTWRLARARGDLFN
ncbi:MAG: glycosyltransferase 87 family protein [Candidatus Baltobacteraceae bacterium]